MPSAQDVRTAAATASNSIQFGLKSAADAAQAALPTKEHLKSSAHAILSTTEAGVSWLQKKVRPK